MPPVSKSARTFPEANKGYLLSALAEDLRAAGNCKETEMSQATPDSQQQHHGTCEKKESEFPE
jgi:hypothetical protein